jgi:hypothetical protein
LNFSAPPTDCWTNSIRILSEDSITVDPVISGQYIKNSAKTMLFCGVEYGENGSDFCDTFALGGGGMDWKVKILVMFSSERAREVVAFFYNKWTSVS